MRTSRSRAESRSVAENNSISSIGVITTPSGNRQKSPDCAQYFLGCFFKIQTIPPALRILEIKQLFCGKSFLYPSQPFRLTDQIADERKRIVVLNGIVVMIDKVNEVSKSFVLHPVICSFRVLFHFLLHRDNWKTCIRTKANIVPKIYLVTAWQETRHSWQIMTISIQKMNTYQQKIRRRGMLLEFISEIQEKRLVRFEYLQRKE